MDKNEEGEKTTYKYSYKIDLNKKDCEMIL